MIAACRQQGYSRKQMKSIFHPFFFQRASVIGDKLLKLKCEFILISCQQQQGSEVL